MRALCFKEPKHQTVCAPSSRVVVVSSLDRVCWVRLFECPWTFSAVVVFLGVSSPNISTCAAGCSSWTVCVRITWCGSNSNPSTRLTWPGIILAVIGLFAGCQSTDRTFIDFMTYFYWGSSSMMIIFTTWVMLVFVLYEIHFHILLYLLHQKPSTCCIHTLKIIMHIWQMLHRAAFHQWECVDLLVRALDIISILLYEMRSVIADAASDTYREDLSSTVGAVP